MQYFNVQTQQETVGYFINRFMLVNFNRFSVTLFITCAFFWRVKIYGTYITGDFI